MVQIRQDYSCLLQLSLPRSDPKDDTGGHSHVYGLLRSERRAGNRNFTSKDRRNLVSCAANVHKKTDGETSWYEESDYHQGKIWREDPWEASRLKVLDDRNLLGHYLDAVENTTNVRNRTFGLELFRLKGQANEEGIAARKEIIAKNGDRAYIEVVTEKMVCENTLKRMRDHKSRSFEPAEIKKQKLRAANRQEIEANAMRAHAYNI